MGFSWVVGFLMRVSAVAQWWLEDKPVLLPWHPSNVCEVACCFFHPGHTVPPSSHTHPYVHLAYQALHKRSAASPCLAFLHSTQEMRDVLKETRSKA